MAARAVMFIPEMNRTGVPTMTIPSEHDLSPRALAILAALDVAVTVAVAAARALDTRGPKAPPAEPVRH